VVKQKLLSILIIALSLKPVETSTRKVMKGRITEIIPEVYIVKLKIDVEGAQFTVYVTRKSFLKMKIDVGCEVSLIFKASSVKIL